MLIGHRCSRCDRAAFPPDPYGCEACGAESDQLAPIDLAANGVIHSLATVHRHHGDTPATPFTVATVVLDGGPTLKAVLLETTEEAQVGGRVRGVTEVTGLDESGNQIVDLRFEVEAS